MRLPIVNNKSQRSDFSFIPNAAVVVVDAVDAVGTHRRSFSDRTPTRRSTPPPPPSRPPSPPRHPAPDSLGPSPLGGLLEPPPGSRLLLLPGRLRLRVALSPLPICSSSREREDYWVNIRATPYNVLRARSYIAGAAADVLNN